MIAPLIAAGLFVAFDPPRIKPDCPPATPVPGAAVQVTAATPKPASGGLVQIVSVKVDYDFHFAYGGMSDGTFRVKVLRSYGGAAPSETEDFRYSWNWSDDGEAEGFMPEIGHVYAYRSPTPSPGDWLDTEYLACTPRPF